ncbi:MAG TPA: ribonuclease domain-containing protein, partial [Nitrospiraceae bacterium]|nr:ribonuclease domain-containing protein [Nitrospiraceae bacterium]
ILILWSLLLSLPPTLQADDLSAAWFAGGPEASVLASPATTTSRPPTAPHIRYAQTVPQKAQELLVRLQASAGKPLPGYVGGHEFQNREHRLPPGHYREYDVNPKIRGRSRDAERIIIEQDNGRAYYSGDHYRTFMPMDEIP